MMIHDPCNGGKIIKRLQREHRMFSSYIFKIVYEFQNNLAGSQKFRLNWINRKIILTLDKL